MHIIVICSSVHAAWNGYSISHPLLFAILQVAMLFAIDSLDFPALETTSQYLKNVKMPHPNTIEEKIRTDCYTSTIYRTSQVLDLLGVPGLVARDGCTFSHDR